jgi:hypothetical protein
MPLATKNGSIIVKDGKLAENCGCCGGGDWYCHVGVCFNAFVGGTKYTVNGTTVPFDSDIYTWNESHSHPSLETVNIDGFAQRVALIDPCQFYLKVSIEVRATVGGYKTFFWSPIFNANDYRIGGPVTDSVSDGTVAAKPQANGSRVTGSYTNPLWASKWASYGTPTFSVVMAFDEISDARCVTP